MTTIFLPNIFASNKIDFGYALYGVSHERRHKTLDTGAPVQCWYPPRCCFSWPNFYPSISQLQYWVSFDELESLCKDYPGREWYIWNEPDVPSQADIDPVQAIPITKEWIRIIKRYNGKIVGYGTTVVHETHWLKDRWKTWLDEWNILGGPKPDYAHVHIYAQGVDEWKHLWERWCKWNEASWNIPTVLSEVGEKKEVWDYLSNLTDSRIVRAHWFTDFTDNPLPGLPQQGE